VKFLRFLLLFHLVVKLPFCQKFVLLLTQVYHTELFLEVKEGVNHIPNMGGKDGSPNTTLLWFHYGSLNTLIGQIAVFGLDCWQHLLSLLLIGLCPNFIPLF
jgi:hypothetical protein